MNQGNINVAANMVGCNLKLHAACWWWTLLHDELEVRVLPTWLSSAFSNTDTNTNAGRTYDLVRARELRLLAVLRVEDRTALHVTYHADEKCNKHQVGSGKVRTGRSVKAPCKSAPGSRGGTS